MGCNVSSNKRDKKKDVKKKGEEEKVENKNAPIEKPLPKCKVLVVFYSMYGHIEKMAKAVAKGAEGTGAEVKIMRIPETLPDEVLEKMKAPKKSDEYKEATPADLEAADCILFGVPTRFGMAAAQVKALMDHTGGLWASGALVGKTAGVFVSTSTQNGGQETTALTFVSQFTHHGMLFVPIGYANPVLQNMKDVKGGTPYGAGCLAGPDGSRLPSELELSVAEYQGKYTAELTARMKTRAVTVVSEKTVDVSAEKVFSALNDWSNGKFFKLEEGQYKAEGKGVGAMRTISKFSQDMVEKLTAEEKMSYSYEMVAPHFGPFPISSYKCTVTVKEAGEGKAVVKFESVSGYYGPDGSNEEFPGNAKDSFKAALEDAYAEWTTNAVELAKA
mmetsp:Transcript_4095/g.5893  ORF Transcript_4095/g.5893 Transcript_4095/m.5893 type:complete len:388 (+) Transcript_4095:119-1282(+)|eukprot:CAMPEP_0184478176 /NCGR_PEP_ID=MMETSP0113_2-20130426/275_1 /TAXON_ID=91329 /ORGANISM="Norrisiella sphaerica, Strain BC52" /LENGTH=387 /DNA_ID=CAMNT_0026855867 /DNA_START=119 /DNA_END=1282 /DNA_ORIENTATION=+